MQKFTFFIELSSRMINLIFIPFMQCPMFGGVKLSVQNSSEIIQNLVVDKRRANEIRPFSLANVNGGETCTRSA